LVLETPFLERLRAADNGNELLAVLLAATHTAAPRSQPTSAAPGSKPSLRPPTVQSQVPDPKSSSQADAEGEGSDAEVGEAPVRHTASHDGAGQPRAKRS
jgi:hypothetical protein